VRDAQALPGSVQFHDHMGMIFSEHIAESITHRSSIGGWV
jgi:hypothetical protein